MGRGWAVPSPCGMVCAKKKMSQADGLIRPYIRLHKALQNLTSPYDIL